MAEEYITVKVTYDDSILPENRPGWRGVLAAIDADFEGAVTTQVLRVMPTDKATAQQIQEYRDTVAPDNVMVFVGLSAPVLEHPEMLHSAMFSRLEFDAISQIPKAIDDYWERQADGVDVGTNLRQLKGALTNIAGGQAFLNAQGFADTYGNHLNMGG